MLIDQSIYLSIYLTVLISFCSFTFCFEKVGLVDEWYYGYTSGSSLWPQVVGQSPADVCRPDKVLQGASYHGQGGVALSGYQVVSNNYTDLMDLLANKGPPVVIFMVTQDFAHYEEGIYDECLYNETFAMNHAVQMVGYGADAETGEGYWLVRNSW